MKTYQYKYVECRVKHVWRASLLLAALIAAPGVSAGPVSKIVGLTPKYNSNEVEITWEAPLAGGCTTSTYAVTNAAAINHSALVAFLLAAFSADSRVEVVFGGGCGSAGSNWIQTIKLVKP
jgi:hypothetical protein